MGSTSARQTVRLTVTQWERVSVTRWGSWCIARGSARGKQHAKILRKEHRGCRHIELATPGSTLECRECRCTAALEPPLAKQKAHPTVPQTVMPTVPQTEQSRGMTTVQQTAMRTARLKVQRMGRQKAPRSVLQMVLPRETQTAQQSGRSWASQKALLLDLRSAQPTAQLWVHVSVLRLESSCNAVRSDPGMRAPARCCS